MRNKKQIASSIEGNESGENNNMTYIYRLVLIFVLANTCVYGAVQTSTNTAPTVDQLDCALYMDDLSVTNTVLDKFWTDAPSCGQSFTTGSKGGILKSFSRRTSTGCTGDSKIRYITIRLVQLTGTASATIASESANVPANTTWSANDWLTWTLDTPFELSPNTKYGIDLEHTSNGTWQDGTPYLIRNQVDDFAGGSHYSRADGDPTSISPNAGHDCLFHMDIDAPPPSGTRIKVR